MLHHLNIEHIDVVKIDAESSEFYVVKGTMNTIRKYLPSIVIEVNVIDIENTERGISAILSLLKPLGYDLFDLIDDEFVKVEISDVHKFGNLVLMVNGEN